MSSKKRGDFLRVLLCPPVLAVVAFLFTRGQKALKHTVDISLDSSLTLVLLLSPIAFYLVIGLLLAVMLDVSDEIRESRTKLNKHIAKTRTLGLRREFGFFVCRYAKRIKVLYLSRTRSELKFFAKLSFKKAAWLQPAFQSSRT